MKTLAPGPLSLRALISAACLALATVAGTPPRIAQAAGAGAEPAAVWKLVSDYQLDGRVDPRETNFLSLTADGRRLAGHFVHKKASGKENTSSFAGEIFGIPAFHRRAEWREPAPERELTSAPGHGTGPTRLLSLRQEDGGYTVLYTGREYEPNHFRGTWYDVSGNCGDFELTMEPDRSGSAGRMIR